MKRVAYKDYVIDTDDLGRQYVYNTNSQFSELDDHIIIGVDYKLADIKDAIDKAIDCGHWPGIASNSHGGYRPGSGRKPTGRKRFSIYVTEDEYIKVREYIDQLRSDKER